MARMMTTAGLLALAAMAGSAAAQTPGAAAAALSPHAASRAPQASLPPLYDARTLATAEALRDKALNDPTALNLLESLTTEIGPRPAGSSAERRAADWAVARLTAMGFAHVHKEPFTVPAWSRGVETAEVISPFPQRLVITALGGSVATPPAGIEAEAALFRTYDELLAAPLGSLTGKIAVVTQPMPRTGDGSGYGANYRIRGVGPLEAAKRGAVAYLLRSLATDDRRLPHTGTMTYVPDFAAGGGSRPASRIPAAALSVPDAEQLERIAARGRPIRLHLTLTPTVQEDAVTETVVGDIVGRERPDEVVLIGGHLDSWDLGTGAIDDGAGVAITAAAARLIGDLPQHPRRTIRLALFGAEEIGKADTAFALAHPAPEQARMVVASECDFGADHIYAIALPPGAADSRFARTLGRVAAPIKTFIAPDAAREGGADLEALKGVPLATLAQDGARYFDLHHTADDTFDKVDPPQMAQNVAAWAAFAYLAAETDVDFRALAAAEQPQPGAH